MLVFLVSLSLFLLNRGRNRIYFAENLFDYWLGYWIVVTGNFFRG
jgi:hypothetical protein